MVMAFGYLANVCLGDCGGGYICYGVEFTYGRQHIVSQMRNGE